MMKKYILMALCMSTGTMMAQWSDQGTGTTEDLNDVFFLDDNNGWAVGRNGAIVRTSDGGDTWTAQNSGTQEDLQEVFMVSASVGYAVGDQGTVVKYNGTSWSELPNVGTTLDMFGVFFLSADQGWISGDWGRIMRTENGGDSWTTENDNGNFSNLMNAIHMFSATDGWAVGTTGKIVHYNGTFWQDVSSGTTTELLGLDFTDASHGIAVGKSGTIRVYNGSDWNTSNSGLSTTFIYDVSYANASLAYAACTDGVILKYDGNVWTKDYEYSGIGTEIFYGVAARASGKTWVAGIGGDMKHLDAGGTTGVSLPETDPLITTCPNPSGKTFFIRLSGHFNGVLRISDLSGRTVKHLPVSETTGTIEVDMNGLNSGVYFIEHTGPEHRVYKHIIH